MLSDEEDMPDLLMAQNLTKDFNRLRVINQLSFEIREGEILVRMGPNGGLI